MLTLLPTPIGNLQDITLRSLEVLKTAEIILCEDTRVSKRLISLLVQREFLPSKEYQYISLHSHNEEAMLQTFPADFFTKEVVYMSDAGMPCISDPGAALVRYAQERDIPYTVLPGANALLTLFAASGSNNKEFYFYGFLPHKAKERQSELIKLLDMESDVIFYEAPHRLMEFLEELRDLAPNRKIFAAKELTKMHEKFYQGSADEVIQRVSRETTKGEWAILLYQGEKKPEALLSLSDLATLDIPPKIRAKILAKMTGRSVEECYKDSCQK